MWYCEQKTVTGKWSPTTWKDRPSERTPSGGKLTLRNVQEVPKALTDLTLVQLEAHFAPAPQSTEASDPSEAP